MVLLAVRIEVGGTVEAFVAEITRIVCVELVVPEVIVNGQGALRRVRITALVAVEGFLFGVFGGEVALEQHRLFGDVRALVAFQFDVRVEQHVGFEAATVSRPGKKCIDDFKSKLLRFIVLKKHLPLATFATLPLI